MVSTAWTYFRDVQTKAVNYQPLIGAIQTADLLNNDDGELSRADAEVLLRPSSTTLLEQ